MEDYFLLQQYHGQHLNEVVDVEADKEGRVYRTSARGRGEGREGSGGRGGSGEGREGRGEGRKLSAGGREGGRERGREGGLGGHQHTYVHHPLHAEAQFSDGVEIEEKKSLTCNPHTHTSQSVPVGGLCTSHVVSLPKSS